MKILELELLLNKGSVPEFIATGYVTKGLIDRVSKYKFVVNSNDHGLSHIHISINNKQVASYFLKTGEPRKSNNPRLDKFVKKWFEKDNNREKAFNQWQVFQNGKNGRK